MEYAFVDESGTADPFSGSRYLVIALPATTAPRTVGRIVRRALKRYGASLASGEMKADASREIVVRRVLAALAKQDIAILAVALDKRQITRPPDDPEDIYRHAVSAVIGHAVSRWPRVDIYLDKRYTVKRLRYRLEREIREAIASLPQQVVIIRQEDSVASKELQAVDYVAWAFFQKYERGDSRFYDIIARRVLVEEVMSRALW